MKLKNKADNFFSILLGTLGSSSLGIFLAGKGINRAGEEIVRASYGNKKCEGIASAGYGNKKNS